MEGQTWSAAEGSGGLEDLSSRPLLAPLKRVKYLGKTGFTCKKITEEERQRI